MPKKGNDRRKGRRKRPPHSNTSSNTSTASAPTTLSTTTVKTSPQQTRGRSTKNSRHGRSNPPRSASSNAITTAIPKKPSCLRNRKTRSNHSPDQPIYFTSPDGELYKPGDFAYVDSQQPDLPFHICLIRSFKLARKESVIAEVKWFYRVTELPEAVYCLLMEDRKKGANSASFELPGVNERELFTAFNIDTHPASLFRGKCSVREISEVKNLAECISKPDHFFYQHGYKPESRRITQLDEFSIIPHSQQAVLPELIANSSNDPLSQSIDSSIVKKEESYKMSPSSPEDKKTDSPPSATIDRYSVAGVDEKVKGSEQLVWSPAMDDDNLLMYLRAARSVALHAGVFINGLMRDGYMAASSDETTQHAFDVLHKSGYNTETALLNIVKKPIVRRLYNKKNWSKENSLLFAKGMRQFGKNFYKIKKELLPNKEIYELIEYYYYWKKTNAGLSSRSTRKQRKQTHIRMSRSVYKQPENSPEREYIDLSSASEDEVDNEDGEKCLSFHACRHCFITASSSWHHAGSNKAILCANCRLHFQRYGFLRKLTSKREPPDFMFKDYHLALAEESGRKTRNSNGIRLPRTGLRNGKVFSKSDSDEDDDDGEITDVSEFSTDSIGDLHHSVSNPKALPSRRSLLDLLQPEKSKPASTSSAPSSSNTSVEGELNTEQPPSKKPKIEENEGNESEEEEVSGDSTTNGEGEEEVEDTASQQSQEEKEQRSPESSNMDEDTRNISHVPSVHTPSATATLNKELLMEPAQEPVFDPVPQQFKRVREDSDHTCARTDLIYVHPPAHEKKAITDPQKTLPPHLPPLTFTPTHVPSHSLPAPPTSVPNHPLGPAHSSSTIPPPHLISSQSRSTGVVPTITPHDPTLPTFINLPGPPHPITPAPFVNIPGSGAMGPPLPPPPSHGNDRDKEMLWNITALRKQQQQQIELAHAAAAAASHTPSQNIHHLPPGIHFHPPPQAGGPPGHVHPPGTAGIPVSQQQPLIFQFPNLEEVARPHRHGGGVPEGLTIVPAGPQFPQLITASGLPIEAAARGEDGQPLQAPIQYALQPIDMVQQQLLLQHHQPAVVAGHLPEPIELQQQVESIVQEYQKDPNVMMHPHVREILAQYHATQNNMYHIQQQQQQMQELIMLQQQEALKQQQQQQQQKQKYHHHQQQSSGNTGASGSVRPGVIISNSK